MSPTHANVTTPPPSNSATHNPDPPPTPPPGVRDHRGRFAKGNCGVPGNPFARQTAALRWALVDCVSEDDIRALAQMLKEKALAGDLAALKLLLTYVVGRPTPAADPDTLDVDEWQILRQGLPMGQELGDVCGSMTPEHLTAYARIAQEASSNEHVVNRYIELAESHEERQKEEERREKQRERARERRARAKTDADTPDRPSTNSGNGAPPADTRQPRPPSPNEGNGGNGGAATLPPWFRSPVGDGVGKGERLLPPLQTGVTEPGTTPRPQSANGG